MITINDSIENYLTDEQRKLLENSVQTASFGKGQVVHRHGNNCVGAIFVRKGRLAFSIISEEGREITLFRTEEGESCILSASCVFQVIELEGYVTAEIASELSVLPAPVLSQLMRENSDVERLMYKQVVKQYSDVLQTMQNIVFFSLEKRLATFLLDESRRRSSSSFSATHEQIARCIGSSREVVTRTLNQFSVRGMVELGRGSVTILDAEELEALLL